MSSGSSSIRGSRSSGYTCGRKGGETDYKEPLIARVGYTVGDVCDMLHKALRSDFKYAQVWGKSVRFGGQKVSLNHKLQDEDVLTFVTK